MRSTKKKAFIFLISAVYLAIIRVYNIISEKGMLTKCYMALINGTKPTLNGVGGIMLDNVNSMNMIGHEVAWPVLL